MVKAPWLLLLETDYVWVKPLLVRRKWGRVLSILALLLVRGEAGYSVEHVAALLLVRGMRRYGGEGCCAYAGLCHPFAGTVVDADSIHVGSPPAIPPGPRQRV